PSDVVRPCSTIQSRHHSTGGVPDSHPGCPCIAPPHTPEGAHMELPDLSHIEITQLPHSLQSLIECIGIENAYRLTCAYGGRPKYIPKHRERTRLADVLPAEALEALIKRFAGVALEIPKADHFLRQLRN